MKYSVLVPVLVMAVLVTAAGLVQHSSSIKTSASYTQTAAVNSMGIDTTNATANDTKLLNGGCDGDPFQALARYGCTRQNECVPSGPNGQGGINSGLACRLTKLFDAAVRAGCTPRIISAYRSAAKQASMCGGGRSGCAPAGRSCHQYGLAVDVTCEGMLRRMAPQYQLHFPYWGPHIQCIEHRQASCNPSTPPCQGGGPIADPGPAGNNQGGDQQPSGGQPSGQGQPQTGQGQQPSGSQPGGSGQPGGDQSMPPGMQPGQDPFQKNPELSNITDPSLADSAMTLTCEPDSIAKGETATIDWECPTGTKSVGVSSSSLAPLSTKGAVSGSATVKPQQKTRYTVQCKKGEVLVAKQTCDIAVVTQQAKMSVRFEVEPSEVYPGETVEVTWSSQNARSCTVTGPGIASTDKSGRFTSAEIEGEETFTIKCKAKTGSEVFNSTKTVTIIEEDIMYDSTTQKKSSQQTKEVQTLFEDPLEDI